MIMLTFDPESSGTETYRDDHDEWIGAGYYAPGFEAAVRRELDRLASLPPNWDGEGAPRIDPRIIKAAGRFISSLPKNIASIPAVVPSSAGTLQFEWTAGRRSLELEVATPETVHYLKWHPDEGVEEEKVIPIDDIERAAILIRWFTRGAAHV